MQKSLGTNFKYKKYKNKQTGNEVLTCQIYETLVICRICLCSIHLLRLSLIYLIQHIKFNRRVHGPNYMNIHICICMSWYKFWCLITSIWLTMYQKSFLWSAVQVILTHKRLEFTLRFFMLFIFLFVGLLMNAFMTLICSSYLSRQPNLYCLVMSEKSLRWNYAIFIKTIFGLSHIQKAVWKWWKRNFWFND